MFELVLFRMRRCMLLICFRSSNNEQRSVNKNRREKKWSSSLWFVCFSIGSIDMKIDWKCWIEVEIFSLSLSLSSCLCVCWANYIDYFNCIDCSYWIKLICTIYTLSEVKPGMDQLDVSENSRRSQNTLNEQLKHIDSIRHTNSFIYIDTVETLNEFDANFVFALNQNLYSE